MCLVIVRFHGIPHSHCIDDRMPYFSSPYEEVYWMPEEMVDKFVEVAMKHQEVSNTSIYKYDRTYKQ